MGFVGSTLWELCVASPAWELPFRLNGVWSIAINAIPGNKDKRRGCFCWHESTSVRISFFYMRCCFCCRCQARNFKVLSVLVSHNAVSWVSISSPPSCSFAAAVCFVLISAYIFLFCPKQIFILSEFVISLWSFITVLFFMDLLIFFIRLFCFTKYLVHAQRESSALMKDFPIPC